MKKILGLLLLSAFLVTPMNAFATLLFTDSMDMDAGGAVWNRWYTDYQSDEYGEAFCVENADMNGNYVPYDFYRIDKTLEDTVGASYIGLLTEATWYANQWATGSASKTDAQVAIWLTLGMGTAAPTSGAGSLMTEFGLANDQDAYVSNWLWAVNPAGEPIEIGVNGQNYLVQNPVPEPATMLLLGTGLLGFAGFRRKMKK